MLFISQQTNKMSINLFKSNWKIYRGWLRFYWTLRKTKKECREAYKKDWCYYTRPAKLTPKIISETYDQIKKFIDDHLTETEDNDRNWWKFIIETSPESAEYTLQSRCCVKIIDNAWNIQFDSRDFMWYNQRRRLCLAFFDNIEPMEEYDKDNYIDAVDSDMYLDVLKEQEQGQVQIQSWDTDLPVEEIPF